MSQSPSQPTPLERAHPYLQNFDALGRLIARGRSFSGHERNCFFLNTGDGQFSEVAPVIGFDLDDDGRSVGIVDWDGDGDLDIWLNGRNRPRVRFLKNSVRRNQRAHFLSLLLIGHDRNRDAIGARATVEIRDAEGAKHRLIRTVRAGEGFLTQSSRWLHFGLGDAIAIEDVSIHWPPGSGDSGQLTRYGKLSLDQRYQIEQPNKANPEGIIEQSALRAMQVDGGQDQETTDDAQPPPVASRVFLTHPKKITNLDYLTDDQRQRAILPTTDAHRLVTLWASWCPHCRQELAELAKAALKLQTANVDCLALCVDSLLDENRDQPVNDQTVLQQVDWPFPSGRATQRTAARLLQAYHQTIYPEHPLTLPFSVLIDREGKIAAFYRGSAEVDRVVHDVHAVEGSAKSIAAAAFPFPGRTATQSFLRDRHGIAIAHYEAGRLSEARSQLIKTLKPSSRQTATPVQQFNTYRLLGSIATQLREHQEAVAVYREAARAFPRQIGFQLSLAKAYGDAGQREEGLRILEALAERKPTEWRLLNRIGLAFEHLGALSAAIDAYQRALDHDDAQPSVRSNLAATLQANDQLEKAIAEYRIILTETPDAMDARNNLAWLLATAIDPHLRRPDEAVQLAKTVVEAEGSAAALDTLAAAYEANLQIDLAIEVLEQALQLATTRRQHELAERLVKRLERLNRP